MCRLAMKTASEPFSPFSVLQAMEAMQEGYDGSGLGLLLRGLKFADYKYNAADPILSGIAHSEAALARLDQIMDKGGFTLKYDHEFDVKKEMIEAQDRHKYVLRVYKKPAAWSKLSVEQIEHELMLTRLALRADGEAHGNDLTAFSLWPDVVMIKEVGWPLEIGDALGLDDGRITAGSAWPRAGRTPTTASTSMPAIPSSSRAMATMTNGENTAFVPIRDWLHRPSLSRLHRLPERLRGLRPYPPLRDQAAQAAAGRPTSISSPRSRTKSWPSIPRAIFSRGLRDACRRLIIDGPNAVIGTLPDETCLLVMDPRRCARPPSAAGPATGPLPRRCAALTP